MEEVELHICERCGYTTNNKHTLIRHLKKKLECPSNNSSRTRAEILKQFEKVYDENAVECSWCNKKFTHKNNLYTHQKNSCMCKPKTQEVKELTDESKTIPNNCRDIEKTVRKMVSEELVRILNQLKTSNAIDKEEVNHANKQSAEESIEIRQTLDFSKDKFIEILKLKQIHEIVNYLYLEIEPLVRRTTTSIDYYKNVYLIVLENGKGVYKSKENVFKELINKAVEFSIEFLSNLDNESKELIDKVDLIRWLFTHINVKPTSIVCKELFKKLTSETFGPQRSGELIYQKNLEKIYGCGHMALKVTGITDLSTDKFHIELKNWARWKEGVGQLVCYNLEKPVDELRLYLFGILPSKYKEIVDVINNANIRPFYCTIEDETFIVKDMVTGQDEKHSIL